MERQLTRLALTAFLLLFVSSYSLAQLTVTGRVLDDEGNGLPSATVLVKNTAKGTFTDSEGGFSIDLSGTSGVLVVRYTGYQEAEVEVSSSNSSVEITLESSETRLDEVVISGLASTVKRSNLASSVASISARRLTGVTNQQTMDGALYGKFKGANITANSGAPGGGITVKLRGITSINANSQPLYIVDGVYMDNSAIASGIDFVSNASGGGSATNQDNPSNRIADLDPEDIETIEILKGASAASIYGSRAAAGVVIITTKRGSQGRTVIKYSTSLGIAQMLNPKGQRTFDAAKVEASFGASEVPIYEAAVANGQLFDYEDLLFGETGFLQTHRISVRGGNENTSFFVGGTLKSEDGIVKNTGYDKQSVRMNLDHKATDWLDLSLSSNFVHSSTDRGFFNNDNSGTTMGISLIVTPPWANLQPDENGNYPNNPYGAANFLQTRDLMTNNENVNRIVTGFTAKAKIYTAEQSALRFVLGTGIDHYDLATTAIFPRDLQFQKDGNGTNGASLQGNTVNTNTNISGFFVHNYYPGGTQLAFTTQAGALALGFDQNTILNRATELIGSQTNVDQSGAVAVAQTITRQRDIGYYVQEEVNYADQLIGTVGVRADKSSNNGDANQLYYYPKASLAWNLHNSFGFTSDFLNQFKVRVAYGQSGNFANFGAKYTTLNNTLIQGNAGSLINTLQGNANVEPERQAELEAGFDLLLLNNKVTFDFSVYRKTVTGLLLNANTPGSSGYQNQVTNGADLQNQGMEIGLSVNAFDTDKFRWTSGANFWFNRSLVTRLDVEPFNVGAFGATLGTFRIEEGQPATQIVGIGPADQDTDGDGVIVWGNSEPDFQIAFPNTLSFSNFQFSFLLHWKQGGDNINLTTLLTDIFGTSPDYDETTLDPTGTDVNGDFRLNALGVTAEPWVEDASYFRVREIGLYYLIPRDKISDATGGNVQGIKVGVSAFNLINIFSYSSYDPEVSNFGANGISTGVEVLPFPSARRINFHLGFEF